MTTTNPQHARSGALVEGWRAFRRWRWVRPFWGGLFTALAGLEIFSTTQMSLGGLSFQMGPTGFLSWLIPTILVACGLLMWFTPQQRMFYAIVGAMTAVFSLIAVNLGGFFIGMLLGMVGGALGFAWVPGAANTAKPLPEPPAEQQTAEQQTAVEQQTAADGETVYADGETAEHDEPWPAGEAIEEPQGGLLTDTLPQPRNPLREPSPAYPADEPEPGASAQQGTAGTDSVGRTTPPYAAIVLVLSLVAAGVLVLDRGMPASAAPCPPVLRPTPTGSAPGGAPGGPAPAPSASPSRDKDGNIIGDLVGGITGGLHDLLGGGRDDQPAEPLPAPATGKPTATPTATRPLLPGLKPGACPPGATAPGASASGKPGGPKVVVPQEAADPDQPFVNEVPSLMTGTKVVMEGLELQGITPLPLKPAGSGYIRALHFHMTKSATTDFALKVPGPADKSQLLRSSELTVEGDVDFYTTRFSGTLVPVAGLPGVPLVLTPDLPIPPDGIPLKLPVPVTFTNPKIDLVYVHSHTLKAPDLVHGLV